MTKLILGLGGLVLVAAAAFFFLSDDPQQESDVAQEERQSSPQDVNPTQPIVCEYTEEGSTTTAYVMNNMSRVNSTTSEGNISAIVKDEMVWFWYQDTKEGWVYEPQELDPEESQFEPITQESIDREIEEQDAECRNENFDQSLLEVPSDVEFMDLSEQFSEQLENVPEDVQEQIPEEYQQYLNQ